MNRELGQMMNEGKSDKQEESWGDDPRGAECLPENADLWFIYSRGGWNRNIR